jgi:hypothetical protein
MEATIPITIAITYDTYSRLLSQGLLAGHLCEKTCPQCPHNWAFQAAAPELVLTNSAVTRTAYLFEKDDEGIDTVVERQVLIVLVKCPICKSRFRVLPADILPRKLYTLPVIEQSVSLYNRGDLSLRQVVWKRLYGERLPAHTTLHGWSEGLGAWWLGQSIGEVSCSVPATRVTAELETRFPQMPSLHSIPVQINPHRHRSQGRFERLEACKQFEITATMLEFENTWKWCELNCLIISWGNSFGFGFKTGICCTAIEHTEPENMLGSEHISPKEPLLCPIHGKSPPSDSK